MLQNKKEQFRQQLRKQRNEDLFQIKRQQRQQTQLSQNQNNIIEFINEVETNNQFNEQKYDKLKQYLLIDYTEQTIYLLQKIIIILSREDFENIFIEFLIGDKLINILEKEKDIQLLDELYYLIGQISQKSMLCQATFIKLGILDILLKLIELEIEYDEQCMQSLLYLLTTFVEYNSRIPFEDIKIEIKILDKLCKKLRTINYLEIDIDFEIEEGYSETKIQLFMRILNFLRFYIDKSSYSLNLTIYQNIWIILIYLAFTIQEQNSLRIQTLQVIADSIKINDQYKLDILEKHPQLFFELLTLLHHHSSCNTADITIKNLTSIIFKQLLSINNPYIIANIHFNQIPKQFVQLILKEQSNKVLYHQIEALFFLCNNSTYEQCKDIYDNGLLQILFDNYQQMITNKDYNLSKQLLKLTYTICKHSQEDQNLAKYLKDRDIETYLNHIVINCNHQNTTQRALKLLEHIQQN